MGGDWLGRLSRAYSDWAGGSDEEEDALAGASQSYAARANERDALPTPSRQTMLGISRLQAPPSDKSVRRAMETDYAKTASERYRGGGPGGSSNKGSETPTDPKEEKAGTGQEATSTGATPPPAQAPVSKYGGYSIVRMPNGKILVTNDPSSGEAMGGTADPEGARTNVASGPAGTVFSTSEKLLIGPGGADMSEVNLPYGADRSPGWAARAAMNEAYRAGTLSMDPTDVMDRRRFEEQEMLRDQAVRDAEIEAATKELGLITAEKQAAMDPYALAEIEAQGKYGGAMLQEQFSTARQAMAIEKFAETSKRIRAMEAELASIADPKSAQAQALRQAIDRAIQERREMTNILLGFRINDPRQMDAFTAMMTAFGGGMGGSGGGGETGG